MALYSRHDGYRPFVPMDNRLDRHEEREPRNDEQKNIRPRRGGLLGKRDGKSAGGLGGFLRKLSVDWDAGDILLVLIVLFMSMESDDEEILLILGLMLLLGL